MDFRADVMAEGSANLHGDAFAAGTSAEEVRDPRRYHDERNQAERNFAFFAMRDVEDDSHAAFRTLAELAVGEDDGDAAQCECRNPV